MSTSSKHPPLCDYVLATSLPDKTDGLVTRHAVDWMMRNRKTNGLAKHVRKVRNRLYVNLPGFADWFDGQLD